MIKVNEVIHLYPNCKIRVTLSDATWFVDHSKYSQYKDFNPMPQMRPLSSLTDAEKIELYNAGCLPEDKDVADRLKLHCSRRAIAHRVFTPAQTLYLLELSVDLFGLIESNQAEKLELCS